MDSLLRRAMKKMISMVVQEDIFISKLQKNTRKTKMKVKFKQLEALVKIKV